MRIHELFAREAVEVSYATLRQCMQGELGPSRCGCGEPTPSPDDVDLTAPLRAAADLVGVLARDHVIVAAGRYYSFVEAGGGGGARSRALRRAEASSR